MPDAQKQIGGIYLIGQMITSGSVVSTYTAYNRNTSDVVGLSVLEIPLTLHPQAIQQLLYPLEQRRSIQSPHILRIHDWGMDSPRVYIATDPPRGITLQQVMDKENIDLQRALDFSKQLAIGLKVFHEKGMVGLDLRPELITIDTVGITDRVQIDDIGLRALLNTLGYSSHADSRSGISYFDPRYLAPEYIHGGQISSESDVYQLGLLLFTLITGRPPFVGRNSAETGMMQTNRPVPQMSHFNHQTPPVLQEIVESAMTKEQSKRFPNAGAMLAALENVQLPLSPAMRVALQQSGKQPTIAFTNEMQRIDENTLSDAITIRTNADKSKALQEEGTVYAYLSFEQDKVEIRRLAIKEKSVVVGRIDPKRGFTPDIDLSTLDPRKTVSRQHARIHFEETFFYIEDLKSRNKTRLGELPLEPLKPELVQHGDVLHFGSVRVRFGITGRGALPEVKQAPK